MIRLTRTLILFVTRLFVRVDADSPAVKATRLVIVQTDQDEIQWTCTQRIYGDWFDSLLYEPASARLRPLQFFYHPVNYKLRFKYESVQVPQVLLHRLYKAIRRNIARRDKRSQDNVANEYFENAIRQDMALNNKKYDETT